MFQTLKSALRDALPERHQVPVKYWYGAMRRELEPEMALLPALVRRGAHVADVGANRGAYSYALHRLGARAELFEPNPACAAILAHWARDLSSVTVHPVGLSDTSGPATLHVPVDAAGIAHDASASVEPVVGDRTHDLTIETRTLDSFGFIDLSFVKIDVEGHESRLLDGAVETIRASAPALLIEIEQRHHPCQPIATIFDQLAALGYEAHFLRDGRLRPLNEFDLARDQSATAFASGGPYINNFLFLAAARIAAGDYAALG